MRKKIKAQTDLFSQKWSMKYGGDLRKKAKNRGARPLVMKQGSLHLVMRSTQAKGEWSLAHKKNRERVAKFIETFSKNKGVKILSLANVGNHLHFHIKIPNRTAYKYWIRGLSSALVMLVIGRKGLRQLREQKLRFWDYRPFTRVINSFRALLNIQDYIQINQFEGIGWQRVKAVLLIKGSRAIFRDSA